MRRFLLLAAVPYAAAFLNRQQVIVESPASAVGRSGDGSIHGLIPLYESLVRIESISGNEGEVGEYVYRYLHQAGLDVEKQYISAGRFNIFAQPKGIVPKVLLSSHLDTVPPFINLTRAADGDRTVFWGRGTCDAKASVATQIHVVLQHLKAYPNLPLGLLFVVGEETNGQGMKFFSENNRRNFSAVVFGEPTERALATGHKGMMSFTLRVGGKAAHSGYPWLGYSATDVLLEALHRIRALEKTLPKSDILGRSTINIGRIEGGVALNVVAEKAEAGISIRIAAGHPDYIQRKIEESLESLRLDTARNNGTWELDFKKGAYAPVTLDTDISGFELNSMNYGTDVPNLEGSHKRYLVGPGSILVAHGPQEHLKLSELEKAVGDYNRIVKHLLSTQEE